MPSAKDYIATIKARDGVTAAYNIVSNMQDFTPAQQVAGVSILFTTVAEQLGISPSELINKAQRMVTDAEAQYTVEVKALRNYVKGELG